MLHSFNEWDILRSVVVGSAHGAAWPRELQDKPTSWTKTPIPFGSVPQWIVDETEKELDTLIKTLTDFDIEVIRPEPRDFSQGGGMYNYCPRDRLLILGQTLVIPQMMMQIRNLEVQCLENVLSKAREIRVMPDDEGMILDAANVCRLNDTLLILESPSGNKKAIDWLRSAFSEWKVETCNFYAGAHIDSTIVPLREGLVVLNGTRVNESNCPKVFKSWDKIWVHDVVERDFYQYPYASKWIGINMLAVNPHQVIVDAAQKTLHKELKKNGVEPIPLTLSHSRTLGGGFHCATLDLVRGTW